MSSVLETKTDDSRRMQRMNTYQLENFDFEDIDNVANIEDDNLGPLPVPIFYYFFFSKCLFILTVQSQGESSY